MRARSPSLIVMAMSTLLSGSSLTSASTRAEYLPRLKYWSIRDCSTSSRTDWLKVLPFLRPMRASGSCRSSVLMSLLPVIVKSEIEGRSATATTSVPLSQRISTSRKKPVPYTARIASRMRLWSTRSPIFTGR